jgi:phytoene/squalene synthetase
MRVPMTEAPVTDTDHCAQEVRAHDPDRWLTALFAPEERRSLLLVLYAFNLELARIAPLMREPMLGRIRLQWWREAIDGAAAGSPRAHPVVRALAGLLAEGRVDAASLTAQVDAREAELDPAAALATLPAVVAWAAGTGGALSALSARVLTGEPGLETTDAGTAAALVGLLRNAEHGQALVPAALHDGVRDEALRRLDTLRRRRFARPIVAAVLPAALARLYLRAPHATPLERQWTLLRAALVRKV